MADVLLLVAHQPRDLCLETLGIPKCWKQNPLCHWGCVHTPSYMGLGKGRDIQALWGALGTEHPREGKKAGCEWNSPSLKKAPVLHCPVPFVFEFIYLSPSIWQCWTSCNDGTDNTWGKQKYIGFRIALGLNLQESLDGLHPLQSEWLIGKQRTQKFLLWPGGQKAQS